MVEHGIASIERVFDVQAPPHPPEGAARNPSSGPYASEGGEPDCPPWSRYTPDGWLANLLGVGPGNQVDGWERLERIGGWEAVIAWAQANQMAEIAAFTADADTCPEGYLGSERDSATAEIGLMLGLSHRAANLRVADALTFTQKLPGTWTALHRGQVSLPAARAIAEETAHLPGEHTGTVERAVLARTGARTPGQTRAAARRAVLATDPEGAARRHAQARRERGVRRYDDPDGMATLAAYLTASDAVGIYGVLDEHARRAAGPSEDRSMDARRADALVDLVLDHTTGAGADSAGPEPGTNSAGNTGDAGRRARRPGAQLRVTLPASTLLGLDNQPADLAGYGPIPAGLARELAADASMQRLLTDPATGALLDYGTTRYSPPAGLASHVTTRDQTCVFPGCRVPAHRCDLDHREPFDPHTGAGPTSAANLDSHCRSHHRLKHRPDWGIRRQSDGTLVWTPPSGHIYRTEPTPLTEPVPSHAATGSPPDTGRDPPPF